MSWYDSAGRDSNMVLGSFATLIRSVEGFAFGKKLSDEKRTALISILISALSPIKAIPLELSALDQAALRVLAEKGFIDLDDSNAKGSLLLDEEHGVSILLGGKNHVMIRTSFPGLAIDEALEAAMKPERMLDSTLELAYSEELGYLTDDPTFLGSAAAFSILLHLPAADNSSFTAEHEPFVNIKHLPGDLLLLTAPPFPGITEAEQCRRLMIAESHIVEHERAARAMLRDIRAKNPSTELVKLDDKPCNIPQSMLIEANELHSSPELSDRAMRAYGILSNAHLMSFEEFMPLWSDLRLGAVSGLPGLPSPEEVGGLLISVLPACLPPDCDPSLSRAEILRRRLSQASKPLLSV